MPRLARGNLTHSHIQIFSVDISPVDNCIASGGDDGKLVVLDATTGRVKFSIDAHKHWIRCITYSPNGTMIATCSNDRTISVWNADDGSRLVGPLNCDAGAVLSVAFSPDSRDGNALVSGDALS
jgi:WD40 repeat protein